MTVRARIAATTGLALAAGMAWEAQRRVDRRRAEADPEYPFLSTRLEGRASTVTARDGTELHVETYGPDDAPTIVFVHGWTCSGQYWKYQSRDLSQRWRIVAYDQRGHGRSGPAGADGYGIEAFGSDLQAVLEACVPDGQRALIAGHSLGGMTIVSWAGLYPDEVQRRAAAAALVDTGMGDLISESLVVRVPTALGHVKQAIGQTILNFDLPTNKRPTPLSQRIVHRIALGPDATPAQIAFCEQLVLACPRTARVGVGATLTRLDLHASLASLTVPALVIVGERDALTPPVQAARMAQALPGPVEVVEIPRVGHMSSFEAPDVVTARLRALAEEHLGDRAILAR